ncbi:DNA alkylation repair protein [Sessilibacter sp. MAH1]
MAESLKDVYSKDYIESLATAVFDTYPQFNRKKFIATIFDKSWPEKPLKARMQHIACSLRLFLPDNYRACLEVLKTIAPEFAGGEQGGYSGMFLPEYVSLFGLHDYTSSINALEWFTRFSSSEFAIRPFIVKHPERTMTQMLKWCEHENYHVRRLASEGCRPRLPWASALNLFKKDPSPILPILETLKHDESLYVRRSVANNLNDISKDHPQIVEKIAHDWLQENNPHSEWIVKHGCRGLLKASSPEMLALFGFTPPSNMTLANWQCSPSVPFSGELMFEFDINGAAGKNNPLPLGNLRLEYALSFMKANGKLSRKVFKISESEVKSNTKSVSKRHSFKPISTRTYYPGEHHLEIIVNGVSLMKDIFILQEK